MAEKEINFYKFWSLNALKNEFVTLFFFLHGKQLSSQVFYISTFQISFYYSKYKGENTNDVRVNDSSSSHLSHHLLRGYIHGSILKMLTATNWTWENKKARKIYHNQFDYMKSYLDLDFYINTNFTIIKHNYASFFFIKLPFNRIC